MNDRPEFLDRLRADLQTSAPYFRQRQRRHRTAASVVGGLALLGGIAGFVVWGGDGATDESVSAIEAASDGLEPGSPGTDDAPTASGVLTDTVKDLDDGAAQPAIGTTIDGGEFGPLEVRKQTPWGAVYACPAGDPTGGIILNLVGGPKTIGNEADDALAAVRAFIDRGTPGSSVPGAPISTSALYVVPNSDSTPAFYTVAAPWTPGMDQPIGALFSVANSAGGVQVSGGRWCTSFRFGGASPNEPVATVEEPLIEVGSAPGGGIQACPAGATSQSMIADFFGDREQLVDEDEIVDFVRDHTRATYAESAPIAASSLYAVAKPGLESNSARAVFAPWAGTDDTQLGAWFTIIKTKSGLGIETSWGCTPFLFGPEDTAGG